MQVQLSSMTSHALLFRSGSKIEDRVTEDVLGRPRLSTFSQAPRVVMRPTLQKASTILKIGLTRTSRLRLSQPRLRVLKVLKHLSLLLRRCQPPIHLWQKRCGMQPPLRRSRSHHLKAALRILEASPATLRTEDVHLSPRTAKTSSQTISTL